MHCCSAPSDRSGKALRAALSAAATQTQEARTCVPGPVASARFLGAHFRAAVHVARFFVWRPWPTSSLDTGSFNSQVVTALARARAGCRVPPRHANLLEHPLAWVR